MTVLDHPAIHTNHQTSRAAGKRTNFPKRLISLSLPLLVSLLLLVACSIGNPTTEDQTTAGQAAEEQAASNQADNQPEENPSASTSEPEPTEEQESTADVQSEAAPDANNAEEQANVTLSFQLVPEGTEARFIVDEILMGNDKTVIGVTSDVTGEIVVAPANPAASEIGTITINARDFKTDSSRRNRAIQRQVLLTANNDYQYITFTPTAIENLPAEVQVGDTINFTVIGELKILDVTRTEAFEMSLTVVSQDELIGLASTTVLYADFGISIPRVPIVASVEDEVSLELEFKAIAN